MMVMIMENDGPAAIENQLLKSQITRLEQLLEAYEKSEPETTNELYAEITKRRKIEEALRQSEERYRTTIEEMEEWYFEADLNGNVIFSNNVFAGVLGYSVKELTGLNFRSFIKTDETDLVYRLFHQVFETGKSTKNIPYEFIHTDGTVTPAEFSIFLKRDKEGKVCGFKGVGHNITERKRSEEAQRTSQLQLLEAMDLAHIVYWEFDPATQTYIFNDPFYAFYGTTAEQEGGYLVSREDYAKRFIHPDDITLYHQFVKENTLKPDTELSADIEHRIVRRNGEVRHVLARARVIRDNSGRIVRRYGVNQDITERRLAGDRIQYLATHDSLTGLSNRSMFSQLLNHAVQMAQRYQRQFALLFIDLDRFKIINDTLGHEAGDQLLQKIAARLKQPLRAVDVVARLGGDEFAVLIEEVIDSSQAATVAHKILTSIMNAV
jgi:PAS domain S-box-containing protein